MLAFAVPVTAWLALGTALPFLPVAHGIARVGDFPRQQMFLIAAATLVVALVVSNGSAAWLAIELTLVATMIVQAALVLPFTPVWRKQSKTYDAGTETGEPLRLISSNVKMSNTHCDELAAEIRAHSPDILILMEVNRAWCDGLKELLDEFPHVVDRSQENSYGMILASKFKLEDTSVQCLLTDGVPSIFTTVVMPKGGRFRLFSIHPEPPVPHETTAGRDGETSLVALKVAKEKLPVIVSGDLNDVAWSKTTRRFRRISGLLDPRIGRKVFSTFDARYFFIRWPLDHLFHSAEFRFVDMQRLKPCGSDHFPVLFDLVLCPTEEAESRPDDADAEDVERAEELVEEAEERDDQPIGVDWEKK